MRHPVDRFYSTYNDFMYARAYHSMVGRNGFGDAVDRVRVKPSITKMLDVLEKFDDSQRDTHWRSQAAFTPSTEIHRYRVENLTRLQELGVYVEVWLNRREKSFFNQAPNKEARIAHIYAKDRELWQRAR
jgi:hypothetical protein